MVRSLYVGWQRDCFREKKLKLAAWSDMWRADLRNRITMLDDPGEVLGACLKKLGYSINSGDPVELEEAARREAVACKATPPRLPERRGAGPTRVGRYRGCAVMGHHVAASHRRRACARFRLSGGGLRGLLRYCGHFARIAPGAAGARVSRLPAAARSRGKHRDGHPDCHRESSRHRAAAARCS